MSVSLAVRRQPGNGAAAGSARSLLLRADRSRNLCAIIGLIARYDHSAVGSECTLKKDTKTCRVLQ